jgi:hypothetical protein
LMFVMPTRNPVMRERGEPRIQREGSYSSIEASSDFLCMILKRITEDPPGVDSICGEERAATAQPMLFELQTALNDRLCRRLAQTTAASGSAKPGISSSDSALIGTCASSWHRIAATDAITRIGMASLGGKSICRAVLICDTDRSI